jgi:hypothetical protein
MNFYLIDENTLRSLLEVAQAREADTHQSAIKAAETILAAQPFCVHYVERKGGDRR